MYKTCSILNVYLRKGAEKMKFTIKQARQYSGKTQKEMARALGIALPTYRDYEHGKYFMRMDRAEKFSQIVKIPIESIFFTSELHVSTIK